MTSPIEVVAAPIRSLLDSVGSGATPAADPATAMRTCCCTLDRTGADLERATGTAMTGWTSTAADRAATTVRAHGAHGQQLSRDGSSIAETIDEATAAVRDAARELRAVLDSFVAATTALGPSVYTPAGVAAVIPIAATHLQRALAIVTRLRARLDSLSRRVTDTVRHRAPRPLGDLRAPHTGRASTTGPRRSASAAADAATHPGRDGSPSTHSAGVVGDAGTPTPAGRPPTPGAVPIELPDGSVAWAPNQRAATAVRAALSQRGVPYSWGGTAPGRGLDCSGLTQFAYRQAGVELPRLAQDQDTAGFRVDRAELLPGDLAVWSGHVAMIVGNGQMIEAGDPVGLSPIRTTNLDQRFEGFYRPR